MEALAKYEQKEMNLVKIEDYAMSVSGLLGQVALIQNVMKEIMHEDEHYGKIPGTDKPTLLKPGAEKLCLTFRLNPTYEIIEKVREKDFIAYTVKCNLTHIISQTPVASGIGSCNSRETKYRYRMVPSDKKPSKEEAAMLKAKGLGRWKKLDDKWTWMDRIENDNPWDLDNTLVKMACKRALVAATLNATAASDIFTQDVEDMPPEIVGGEIHSRKEEPPKDDLPEFTPPQPKETKSGPWSTEQRKMIWAKCKDATLNEAEAKAFIRWYSGRDEKLTSKEASLLIDNFDKNLESYQRFMSSSAPVEPEAGNA